RVGPHHGHRSGRSTHREHGSHFGGCHMSSHHEHRSKNDGPLPEEHRAQEPAPVADNIDTAATEPGEENFPEGAPTGDGQGLSSPRAAAKTGAVAVLAELVTDSGT